MGVTDDVHSLAYTKKTVSHFTYFCKKRKVAYLLL